MNQYMVVSVEIELRNAAKVANAQDGKCLDAAMKCPCLFVESKDQHPSIQQCTCFGFSLRSHTCHKKRP